MIVHIALNANEAGKKEEEQEEEEEEEKEEWVVHDQRAPIKK